MLIDCLACGGIYTVFVSFDQVAAALESSEDWKPNGDCTKCGAPHRVDRLEFSLVRDESQSTTA